MSRFLKGFGYALRGIWVAIEFEQNLRLHLISTGAVVILGLYLKIPLSYWGIIILAIGFVLTAELFNTAIERLGDKAADGKQDQLVKYAKDISASAVLISALMALIVGILFLFVPLAEKIEGYF